MGIRVVGGGGAGLASSVSSGLGIVGVMVGVMTGGLACKTGVAIGTVAGPPGPPRRCASACALSAMDAFVGLPLLRFAGGSVGVG